MDAKFGTLRGTIVTAAGLDLGPLFDVFRELGNWDFWVLGNEIGDPYLFDPNPDVVVGVLKPNGDDDGTASAVTGLTNLDVMLRVGRAVERRIPTLVILPPSVATPSSAMGVVFVSCPLNDKQALNMHLWAFTTSIRTTKPRPSCGETRVSSKVDAALILRELSNLPSKQPDRSTKFEELVSDLLQQAGAKLMRVAASETEQGKVDIAILPSEDSRSVVLVEVKVGNITDEQLALAEQQISNYVMDRRASLGMVVY